MQQPSETELRAEIDDLHQRVDTLMLATTTPAGEPEASAAPFLWADEAFHLLLSDLAPHSGNLRATGRVSVLLLQPEQDSGQPFARRRLSYACRVEALPAQAPLGAALLDRMQARFGPVVELLRGLEDFRLYRLRPRHGRYVRGFGQAYELAEGALRHPRPIRRLPGR